MTLSDRRRSRRDVLGHRDRVRIQHLPHLAEQRVGGKRLLKQRVVRGVEEAAAEEGLVVTGDKEHLRIRSLHQQAVGHLPAVHPRHDHIGQDEVEGHIGAVGMASASRGVAASRML